MRLLAMPAGSPVVEPQPWSSPAGAVSALLGVLLSLTPVVLRTTTHKTYTLYVLRHFNVCGGFCIKRLSLNVYIYCEINMVEI